MPELISQVKNTNIFSKFNIHWGYNNVRIKEGDQHKAAFKTKYRLYVTRPVLFFSFLDYWQVTLIWSPYGDASLIHSFTYW